MKSILVVSTAFAPENAIGAVRVSKLVKYLVRLGHPVTVISPELARDVPRDASLECPEFESVRRFVVPQGRLFDKLFAGRRKKLLKGGSGVDLVRPKGDSGLFSRTRTALFRQGRFVYSLLRNLDWSRQVLRFVDAHPALRGFDVVLSSYPSLGGMWAASALRRQGVAGRWVADFRDPVNYRTGSGSIIYWWNTRIQRRLLDHADAVIAVSEGVASKLERDGARNLTVIYNGFDPEDASVPADARAGEVLQLCYTGSLYGGARDISAVFAALRKLADGNEIDLSMVRFAYAGTDFPALVAQASAHGLEGILMDRGRLSRSAALALLDTSDVAVVATWNTPEEQGIMTGKLFECFMVRTPVLGVVNGSLAGSEFARVVSSVKGGYVYEEGGRRDGDLGELARFLLLLYARRHDGILGHEYDDDVLDYSYPRLAAAVSSIA